MIKQLIRKIFFLRDISIILYVYLNYCCPHVIRKDRSKIIPYKNSVIEFSKDSRIVIYGGNLEIGADQLKRSKAETRIRLRENALWIAKGGCRIAYGCTVEVLNKAELNTCYFTMNNNSVLVAANKITLGKNVMISRNVVIYDSDFHSIIDGEGRVINASIPVIVGNHVWLAANVIVLKGSKIQSGSVVGAGSIVSGPVEAKSIYQLKGVPIIKKLSGHWSRLSPDIDE